MEQSVPLAEAPVARNVRIRHTMAAVFISVPAVAAVLSSFVPIGNPLLVNASGNVAMLLACFLLYGTASNRATKTAMLSVGCWMGCWTLLSLLINVFQLFSLPEAVLYGFGTLHSLIWILCFAVVIGNNRLQPNTVSWIGILCMMYAVAPVPGFRYQILRQAGAAPEEMYSRLIVLFWVMCRVLTIIGWFKFARSEAFAGNYDGAPAPKGAYSPFNKYLVGAIVVAGALCAALWCLYRFAAPLLRAL